MKATETNCLKFLKEPKQFVIPIYQRTYSWTLKQCQQLWYDIVRAAEDKTVSGHFIGSVVYIERGLYQVTSVPQLLVIDGQQRLTTLSILLAALGKVIEESGERLEISRKKIENYYLFNNEEEGDARYKLLLTQSDKETLIRLIEERESPSTSSRRIAENYQYFESQIRKQEIDLNSLYQGISKLIIVDIALERDHDNPQLIFESLNSTGLDLSQADLIRNYVLMGLEPKEQEEIYKKYWFPMEQSFGQAGSSDIFDRFMRDYLTVKSRGAIPNIRDVYSSFKSYVQKQKDTSIKDIVADIYHYSKYFVRLAFEQEIDPEIKQALVDINTLKVDVAYPFLLEVYEDYTQKLLRQDEFISILRLIESYVFRRAICGLPTNSMNKTFAALSREINRDNYLESLQIAFIRKDAYKRFPNDEEFRREFVVKDIYNFRSRNYLLRKLENYDRLKELVNVEDYTIEHILPQNPKLSKAWQVELGENWKEIQAKYLHTIGNLTLTGYNSEYGDRSFREKRNMKDGFADSPLRLNRILAKLDHWNEIEIKNRAEVLADKAIQVWLFPSVRFALPNQNLNVQEILLNVFPTNEDLSIAKTYVQEVVDIIGYDRIEHILSITCPNKKAISVNLGQWLVLRFKRELNSLKALFAIDFGILKCGEGINIYKIKQFSNRWSNDKDIRLVWLNWSHQTSLSDTFIEAWYSAIYCAYELFKSWDSSSYMIYHQQELAQVFVPQIYQITQKKYLQGEVSELFEVLRKQILNLDASVKEEFKKYYIAYKTTTNFVDITPQRSRLLLFLNLEFEEINDPKGLCRDVTSIGHHGNGDVEVSFSSLNQIDDVMFLVRQAFNKYSEELVD